MPPLQDHTWVPQSIQIFVDKSPGDGGGSYDFPPELILFGDKQLIISNPQSEWFTFKPLTKALSREETCKLLNTIDQVGYFDYDYTTYRPPFEGSQYTHIAVDSWRSNTSWNQALERFVWDFDLDEWLWPSPPPVVLPAIADTYKLLASFSPIGLEPYQPEKLILWLQTPYGEINSQAWPINTMSLDQLVQIRREQHPEVEEFIEGIPIIDSYPIIIEGDFVTDWLAKEIKNGIYSQGNLTYEVLVRPLWPFEALNEHGNTFIDETIIPTPTEAIQCKVSDGVLPIP